MIHDFAYQFFWVAQLLCLFLTLIMCIISLIAYKEKDYKTAMITLWVAVIPIAFGIALDLP